VRAAVRAREKASMTRAATWREELGVGQYAQVFASQSNAFAVISDLTEVDLEKPGIPLRRKRTFKAIGALAGRSSNRGYRPSHHCTAWSLRRETPTHHAVLRSRGRNGVRNSLALGRDVPADAARPRPRGDRMRRREFITLLGGAAAWPLAARAQQGERMRRIGIVTGISVDDPESKARVAAFLQELQRFGWTEGRNVRIDFRGGAGETAATQEYVRELVGLAPDVILSIGNVSVGPLIQATRTVPIVFTLVVDPVGAGFVDSLSQPGGNATGFMSFEYSLSGKWLEILKEISPRITRAAILRDPTQPSGIGQFAVIQSVAPALGVEVYAINVRDAREIERAITAFGRLDNGGVVATAGPLTAVHRDLIAILAGRHKLPAVNYERLFAAAGGLISYGPNFVNAHRQAAGYVDRILKGEKPADLPVQAPTKYDLVINLKAAKAIGLTVPPSLLARADEVIE
jgi:putative tryptophan/tyrosine transport system substrate-binding protein